MLAPHPPSSPGKPNMPPPVYPSLPPSCSPSVRPSTVSVFSSEGVGPGLGCPGFNLGSTKCQLRVRLPWCPFLVFLILNKITVRKAPSHGEQGLVCTLTDAAAGALGHVLAPRWLWEAWGSCGREGETA